MRLLIFPLLLAACASAPMRPLTAEDFAAEFSVTFVTPTPTTFGAGLDLPLRPGDRIIANCAQAYAYQLPDMTPDEQREFNESVVCIFPEQAKFDQSMRHYMQAMQARRFEDDSGTYVQSAMRIACNQTHTVMTKLQSQFIPSFVRDENGDTIEIEGGGELTNIAILFSIADRPCERFAEAARKAEIAAQPPAPNGYVEFPQPLFVEPSPAKIGWGAFEITLRPQDRVVAHCAQYYSEEISQFLHGSDFGHWNLDRRCIYPPQDEITAASAYYAEQLREKGLTGTNSATKGDPAAEYPPLRAGTYEWNGLFYFCDRKRLVGLDAMARFGSMTMLDPLTGEFWSMIDAMGGRRERLEGANFQHQVLVMFERDDLLCDL